MYSVVGYASAHLWFLVLKLTAVSPGKGCLSRRRSRKAQRARCTIANSLPAWLSPCWFIWITSTWQYVTLSRIIRAGRACLSSWQVVSWSICQGQLATSKFAVVRGNVKARDKKIAPRSATMRISRPLLNAHHGSTSSLQEHFGHGLYWLPGMISVT